MEKGNQKRRGRRGQWKFTSGLLAGLLALALTLGLAPGGSVYAAAGDKAVADGQTLNDGLTPSQSSTDEVGKIWTDKTVSTDKVTLSSKEGSDSISKADDADFLIGLSALSSTSNLTTSVNQPLDIVLVLDRSGSMGDNFSYSVKTKKITALKTAVKDFIDATAEASTDDVQHRIALVSYASDSSIDSDFSTDYSNLKRIVDGLNASGGTQAGEGMSDAKIVMNGGNKTSGWGPWQETQTYDGARDGAKKVLIFFTDGKPGDQGFDNSVAGSAINTAKELKDTDTTIYSVGVFSGADPSDISDQFNKYMNAVSSNYPEAECGNVQGMFGNSYPSFTKLNLGQRVDKDEQYYFAASDSDSLNQVFEDIASDMTVKGSSPTKVGQNPSESGYITFEDKLGDYMKVTGDKITVVYAGESYTGTIDAATGAVTFEKTQLPGNGLYDNANLSDLRVTIQRGEGTEGDTVKVEIPATLIPLHMYEVKNGAVGSVEEASPIRIFYNVKLSEDARTALEDPESDLAKSAVNGAVAFYSNQWNGSGNGTTTASFTPADGNDYYKNNVSDSKNKAENANATVTAATVYTASWSAGAQTVTYSLGNNGKLTVQADGALLVTKTTTADEGLTVPAKEFSFKLTLKDGEGKALSDTFNAKKGNEAVTVEVKDGECEFQLKNDESLYIYGLPAGAAYTVTEQNIPGGFTVQGTNPVTGSIKAGEKATETFTNKYAVQTATLPGSENLKVSKTLEDREWLDNDSFTFTISADAPENAPLPAETTLALNKANPSGSFGDITFTKPGTYTYLITENEGDIAGIEYSKAQYSVTVTVTDNQDGTLGVASVMKDAKGKEVQDNTASFTNTYSADPAELTAGTESELCVTKKVTGAPALSEFEFKLELTSNNADGVTGLGADNTITKSTTVLTGKTDKETVGFGTLTFTKEDTYTFTVTETTQKPDGAKGWTYDNASKTITVEVTDENFDGKLEAEVTGNNQHVTNAYTPESVTITGDAGTALKVTKKVTGDATENDFSFTLSKVDPTDPKWNNVSFEESALKTEITENFKAGDEKTASFGDMTFKAAGTYVFTVVEDQAQPGQTVPSGWTYDNSSKQITVTVTDKGYDGQLDATVSGTPVFENKYETAEDAYVDFGIELDKVLTGKAWTESDSFTFEIEGKDNAPMPAETQVTVSYDKAAEQADGTWEAPVAFGDIRYTAPGVYEYTIREVNNGNTGITCTPDEITVQVQVESDHMGGYTASVKFVTDKGVFTNKYETDLDYSADGGLSIVKTLENHDIAEEQFSFEITPLTDAAAKLFDTTQGKPVELKNKEAAFMDLGPNGNGNAVTEIQLADEDWTFTNADDTSEDPEYVFTVKETGTDSAGYTYDQTTYTVKISVEDDGNGKLEVTTEVYKGEELVNSYTYSNKNAEKPEKAVIPFRNTYEAGGSLNGTGEAVIQAGKTLTGRDMKDSEFTFTVTASNGTEPKIYTTGANAAAADGVQGAITFDAIQYTKSDLNQDVLDGYASYDADTKTYTYLYTVAEKTPEQDGVTAVSGAQTVTVTVKDQDNGALEVKVQNPEGGLSFENLYNPEEVTMPVAGQKQLDTNGLENAPDLEDIAGKYSFTITGIDEEGNPAPLPEKTTVQNEADGKIDFGKITFKAEDVIEDPEAEEVTEPEETEEELAESSDETQKDKPQDESIEAGASDTNDGNTDASEQPDAMTGNPEDVKDKPEYTPDDAVEESDTPDTDTDADVPEKDTEDVDVPDETVEETVEETDAENSDTEESAGEATVNALDLELLNAAPGEETAGDESGWKLVKTYTYTVTESVTGEEVPGVSIDTEPKTFTIEVYDDDEGHLQVKYDSEKALFTFTNTYSVDPTTDTPTGDGNGLTITKKVTGRALVDKEFDFELVDQRTNEVAAKGTNDANGNVELSGITFEKPGTYSYILREKAGTAGGVSYDTASYKVKAEVTDDGDGTMSVAWKYGENEAAELEAVFQNTYTAAPTSVTLGAVKRLDGRTLAAGEFTFRLTDESGKVVSEAKNDANGTISFSALTFDKAGTYKYTVTEVKGTAANVTYDGVVYNVTIHVVDNNNGQLTAQVDNGGKSLVFTNTYTEPAKPDNDNDGGSSSGGSGSSSPSQVQVSSAQTGDDTNILLPLIGICVSGAVLGICAVVIYNRKKKTE